MAKYDAVRFKPPACTAVVTLRNPDTGATSRDVYMLMDTGADVSLLPYDAIQQIGVQPLQDLKYELASFDGVKSIASVVRVDLLFCGRYVTTEFVLTQQDTGILGRNVLNKYRLLLDGPNETWEHVP